MTTEVLAAMLEVIHGGDDCHICGQPKRDKGSKHCSYPHGGYPAKHFSEGMYIWERPNT